MPRFAIQQHAATSMHFDFRIEVAGTFKSWAVPKGPSTDPRDKRLAMAVDDHALSWGDFEGVIAEGEYGAGPVIVWDRGDYRNLREEHMEEGLERGHLSFWLEGEKLRGGWSLRRIGGRRWLLVKRRDEGADARRDPVTTQRKSVLSGRTIEEVRDSLAPLAAGRPAPMSIEEAPGLLFALAVARAGDAEPHQYVQQSDQHAHPH